MHCMCVRQHPVLVCELVASPLLRAIALCRVGSQALVRDVSGGGGQQWARHAWHGSFRISAIHAQQHGNGSLQARAAFKPGQLGHALGCGSAHEQCSAV